MKKSEKPQPNIAFIGAKNGYSPVRLINTEPKNLRLPANQSKPFYHKHAEVIVRLFPYLYKKVISKS